MTVGYYCSGCNDCDWAHEGTDGTGPARAHTLKTGHSTFAERTTVYTFTAANLTEPEGTK